MDSSTNITHPLMSMFGAWDGWRARRLCSDQPLSSLRCLPCCFRYANTQNQLFSPREHLQAPKSGYRSEALLHYIQAFPEVLVASYTTPGVGEGRGGGGVQGGS